MLADKEAVRLAVGVAWINAATIVANSLGNRSGAVDYFYASCSGFVLVGGWVDDEGEEFGQLTLSSPSGSVAFAHESVQRLKRSAIFARFGNARN